MSHLYLFSASFPYDNLESFMEDEIIFLSKAFEGVTIIPLYGGVQTREVPKNCVVLPPVESSGITKYVSILFPNKATLSFLKDFFKKKAYLSGKRIKTWIIAYRQICNLLKSRSLKIVSQSVKPNDVMYFYWGKGSVSLALFFKGKAKLVSRFHGEWDLWEESSGNYAPLRDRIAESLDLAAFISKKGEDYFNERYKCKNTMAFPLGSLDNGVCLKSSDGILRIVSCSSVYPLKRVPLLHDALLQSNLRIEWTHLGGGSHFEELKEKVNKEKRDGLTVFLTGQMSHDEVIAYYKTHKVDLFVNLSTNEGVPVSIMEAISFDIPVLATNVGATSEVVRELSGVLIGANPSPREIAMAIEEIMKKKNSLRPRDFWSTNYYAEVNYKAFAKRIANL